MSAKFFGTTSVAVDGVEYRLVLDFNAICHFEDVVGLNFFEVAASWEKPGAVPAARHLRALVHAAMLEHHPDATDRDAGRVLSEGMGVFEQLMASAMAGMQPASGKKTRAAAR